MDDLLTFILFDNPEKGIQYRLTVSQFRDMMYLGIREWYISFDGTYQPTNKGVTMPYNLHTVSRLVSSVLSLASSKEIGKEVMDSMNGDIVRQLTKESKVYHDMQAIAPFSDYSLNYCPDTRTFTIEVLDA